MILLRILSIVTAATMVAWNGYGQETVAITEFLASNRANLADGDGLFPDWVEIHNFSTEPVDIGGWFLTDDADNLNKWEFPATTLNSGEFLVVFASNQGTDDYVDPKGNLHANFQLSSQGEYLGLIASDGTSIVSEFAPLFPVQSPDISYGRDGDLGAVGFFETPTPGRTNQNLDLLDKPITFSRSSGTFVDAFELTLSADLEEGQQIHYTTDGSPPSILGGAKIESGGAISINENTQIRAGVFQGGLTGPFASAVYLKIADDLKDFSSNLPLVVIDTAGKRIAGTSSTTLTAARTLIFEPDAESGRTAVTSGPHYAGKSGLRIRGRSSAGFAKKQYKFEFWDEEGKEKNFSALGLGGESDWILSAPYTDKSLMRNVLTYRLWGEAGWPTVDGRFVEVFINEDRDKEVSYDDDYLGVYVLMENITIDDDRVNISPPEDTTNPGEITGGFIMESGNPGGAHFSTRTSKKVIPYRHKDPNQNELNSQQRAWIRDRIEQFERAIVAEDFKNPETGLHYSEYTDAASQVDYRLYREWTRNFDGGSTYFFIPRGGKITMGPLWDYNWALGNVNYAEGGDKPGYFIEGWNRSFTSLPPWSPWPLLLEGDPDHWQLITDRWVELRQELLRTDNVHAMIDEIAALLEESAARNFEKWKILGRFTNISPPGYQQRTTYQSEVDYLKDWLRDRMAWMDSAFPQSPNLTQNGGQIPANFQLTMASPNGPVYYTKDGSDPRAGGGVPSQTAVQFPGGPVDINLVKDDTNVRYLIPPDSSLGDTWLQPDFDDAAWTEALSPLGFETPGGPLESSIRTDLKAEMRGVNASIYIRHVFDFDNDPGNANGLRLKVKYDDTFVAWLNGVEVARDPERTPETVTWDSFATNSHADSDALEFLEVDISNHRDKLARGKNVLAVQAMNTAAGSSDLIVQALLDGNHSVTAQPITLTESTLITARTKSGNEWSAPVTAYFSVGEEPASAANLVISEIMYHPEAPSAAEVGAGFTDQELFEFVELHNVSDGTVNIFDLAFVDGIEFDFSQSAITTIAPGGYAILVSNVAAFEARYGAGIAILGAYHGNLRNRGELLELRSSDAGIAVVEFDDAWHPSTDGEGFSLTLADDSRPPVDWNMSQAWQASAISGGSPGSAEGRVPPDDGLPVPEVLFDTVNGKQVVGVRFQRNLEAGNLLYELERSENLTEWAKASPAFSDETDNGDGTFTVTILTEILPGENRQLFLRLRITQQQ